MSTTIEAPKAPSLAPFSRTKCLSYLKSGPTRYAAWREPISERQLNDTFERHILPDLTGRLESTFQGLAEFDREDAVQDCVCQAFEAYRLLRLYENGHHDVAPALAAFASGRYRRGVRFAASASASSAL